MSTRRLRAAWAVLAAASLGVAGAGTATAATPPSGTSGGATYSAVRDGTAAQSHGVKEICADNNLACLTEALTTAPGSGTLLSSPGPLGYGANELQAAYHLADGAGGAGTIAIIDAGADTHLQSDLATYRKQYGLPPCTTQNGCFKQVSMDGGPPLQPNPDYPLFEKSVSIETSLDMDMASAACPDCNLIEVQVPITDAFLDPDHPKAHGSTADFAAAVQTAVDMHADAVSISYNFPSDDYNDSVSGRELFQPGTAVVASSGDSGFNDPTVSGPFSIGAPWPQNLPWVISAGGTTLYAPTPTKPDYTETAWTGSFAGGTGSGCDPNLEPALGQPNSVSRQCNGHRAGSDISAVADPVTGVAVYDSAKSPITGKPFDWLVVGGTSASSPLIAGMYTRAGHTAGVTGPNQLYAQPDADFTDVTVGQNAVNGTCQRLGFAQQVCRAGPGWDGPTGLGTPNGLAPFT